MELAKIVSDLAASLSKSFASCKMRPLLEAYIQQTVSTIARCCEVTVIKTG